VLTFIAAVGATGGNPSAITTALIALSGALGGALIGGAVTGVTQWKLEGRRAETQRELEDARSENEMKRTHAAAIHQGNLDHEQAKRSQLATDAQVTAICRGAARMLIDDFGRAGLLFKTAAEAGSWWPSESTLPPRLDPDDRRALASRMESDAWLKVANADRWITVAYSRRELQTAKGNVDIGPNDADHLKHAMNRIKLAEASLGPLAQ
jgi:hypothetical protein